MSDLETAEKVLEEIRDPNRLSHLRRRPRCADGSLDMRNSVNQALKKNDRVTDFYDPIFPGALVETATIEQLQADQQQRYDAARFRELTDRVDKLERERSALLRYQEKA